MRANLGMNDLESQPLKPVAGLGNDRDVARKWKCSKHPCRVMAKRQAIQFGSQLFRAEPFGSARRQQQHGDARETHERALTCRSAALARHAIAIAVYNPRPIFRFIAQKQAEAKRVALVTVRAVTGSSARSPGTHMAVSEDGSYAGSFTGGCIEAAIVAEAQEVFAKRLPCTVRYGAGSPYIDIRLPCGGSVDLAFQEVTDSGLGARVDSLFASRTAFSITILDRGELTCAPSSHERFSLEEADCGIAVHHIPPLRLALFGHANALPFLRDLALGCQAEVLIFSPDAAIVEASRTLGCKAQTLTTPTAMPDLDFDHWTAAALLFHDHDWEPPLLARLAAGPAFFVGAMGSHKTHAARCAALRELGVSAIAIERIVSPIGIIPSMRDPETLAVSTLAQVVERYNRAFLF
jgi:xanthine dehydrogenase accessory factor